MGALTTASDIYKRMAAGQGQMLGLQMQSNTTTTAGNSDCGFLSPHICMNTLGTTWPNTFQDIPLPAGLSGPLRGVSAVVGGRAASCWVCRYYLMGVLTLSATGNQFVHDAATFPITRTQMGATAQPLTLLPMLQLTTATTTTVAEMYIRNATGPSTGYTDQDGNSVQGAKLIKMPAAATAVQSGFILPLEHGDSGVRDITHIDVTVAASAGVGNVWGLELLLPVHQFSSNIGSLADFVYGGLLLEDLKPGVATSGTVTSYLGLVSFSTTSQTHMVFLNAVLDT